MFEDLKLQNMHIYISSLPSLMFLLSYCFLAVDSVKDCLGGLASRLLICPGPEDVQGRDGGAG